ncbi:hypothetical protein PoB_003166000 [Plakobranchus ocellatus]|uniref:Uncharacterized protein n=1 Tax=Plakobranchus ocellatus TaxID=259542 RepID=A0AAV4AAF6_9GAST|nr:hypothetical protein PoB_003166000 [Plakobranchus ocellatus]
MKTTKSTTSKSVTTSAAAATKTITIKTTTTRQTDGKIQEVFNDIRTSIADRNAHISLFENDFAIWKHVNKINKANNNATGGRMLKILEQQATILLTLNS